MKNAPPTLKEFEKLPPLLQSIYVFKHGYAIARRRTDKIEACLFVIDKYLIEIEYELKNPAETKLRIVKNVNTLILYCKNLSLDKLQR